MELQINDNFLRSIVKETTRTIWFKHQVKYIIEVQVEKTVRKILKKVYDTGFKDGFNKK